MTTDGACDLSHLVEEYEIDDAQETTLYFYQKNQKDYSNILFVTYESSIKKLICDASAIVI